MSETARRVAEMNGRKLLIWLVVSLLPLTVLAAIGVEWRSGGSALSNPFLVTFLSFGLTGAIIVLRRHGNLLGWFLFSMGLLTNIGVLAVTLASAWMGEGIPIAAGWADAGGNLLMTGMILAIPAILILFPDGSPPSRRWRWFLSVVLLTALLGSTAALLNGGWGGDIGQAIVVSPLRARTAPIGDVVSQIFFIGLAVSMIGAAASVLFRFRRSRALERQQIKWLAAAGFVVVVSLSIVGFNTSETWEIALVSAAFSSIPVAIGIAILRYRLYDIDRIISRAVGYALVVGLLGLLVAGVSAVAGSQFQTPWVVAATTLGVAALFNPVRRRMQVWVDRRFNRSKYDAERVVAEFAGSLRDRVDSVGVVDGWLAVVSETMQPSSAGVWVKS